MQRFLFVLILSLLSGSALAQPYWGEFADGGTLYFHTNTIGTDGAPETPASETIAVYKDNSATQLTTGATIDDDFDSVVGFHQVAIDTTQSGFDVGSVYVVAYSAGTSDSISLTGRVIGSFRLGPAIANVTQVDGAALDTHDAGCFPSDLVEIADAAVSTSSAQLGVNVVGISGDTASADNLELLTDADAGGGTFEITEFSIAEGATITSSDSNETALTLTGNGSGEGMRIIAGATGEGLRITSTESDALLVLAAGADDSGLKITGGATGASHGVEIAAAGTGNAIYAVTTGTASTLYFENGGTDGNVINLSHSGSSIATAISLGAIQPGVLDAGSITATVIANDAIDASAIANSSIDAATFASGAIDATAIAADAIASSELAATAAQEIEDEIWNALKSAHTTADTFGDYLDDEISQVSGGGGGGLTALADGTAQAGSSSTIQLASAETFANDILNGTTVNILAGTGAGQSRLIYDYTGSTDTADVTPAWTTNPSSDSEYEIVQGTANVAAWQGAAVLTPTIAGLPMVQDARRPVEWWVATTGNDSNDGTFGSPKLTLAGAQSAASSGDVINLKAGTYTATTGISKRLIIRGRSSRGSGVTTITASSTGTLQLANTADGTVISDVEITYTGATGSAVFIEDADNVLLENVAISATAGTANMGVQALDCDGLRVIDSVITASSVGISQTATVGQYCANNLCERVTAISTKGTLGPFYFDEVVQGRLLDCTSVNLRTVADGGFESAAVFIDSHDEGAANVTIENLTAIVRSSHASSTGDIGYIITGEGGGVTAPHNITVRGMDGELTVSAGSGEVIECQLTGDAVATFDGVSFGRDNCFGGTVYFPDEDIARQSLAATTIATRTSQTVFTLTDGSSVNDAYNGLKVTLYDVSNSNAPSICEVLDYTGSTKTVTLVAAPNFTTVAGDGVMVEKSATLDAQYAGSDIEDDIDDIEPGGGTVLPINQTPVPVGLTWKIKRSSASGLVGEKTISTIASDDAIVFAVDFAADLATNGRLTEVDSVTIVSGGAGVTLGADVDDVDDYGVDRSQAKVRITPDEAGTYVLRVSVDKDDSDGGGTAVADVTLVVSE